MLASEWLHENNFFLSTSQFNLFIRDLNLPENFQFDRKCSCKGIKIFRKPSATFGNSLETLGKFLAVFGNLRKIIVKSQEVFGKSSERVLENLESL